MVAPDSTSEGGLQTSAAPVPLAATKKEDTTHPLDPLTPDEVCRLLECRVKNQSPTNFP